MLSLPSSKHDALRWTSVVPYTLCGADDDGTFPETPLVITVSLTDSSDYDAPGPVDYLSGCFIPTASEFSINAADLATWETETYWPAFVAHLIGKSIGFG